MKRSEIKNIYIHFQELPLEKISSELFLKHIPSLLYMEKIVHFLWSLQKNQFKLLHKKYQVGKFLEFNTHKNKLIIKIKKKFKTIKQKNHRKASVDFFASR